MKEQIIIAMPAKNASKTIAKSIESILSQKNVSREIILLIGNDESTDTTQEVITSFQPNSKIIVLPVSCGTAHGVRNLLNDYIRNHFPNCVLIGRLDADDTLKSSTTLSQIEKLYDSIGFDILFAGNQQKKENQILEWENHSTEKLLDDDYLLQRLKEMKEGNARAELPSCNTFIRPSIKVAYPPKISAEDHWFSIELLLMKNEVKIHIAPNLIYCIYSLDGLESSTNSKNNHYIQSRIELYQYFKSAITK